jgi:hypothetical protein
VAVPAVVAGRGGGPAVVVADERGREVASVPLPASGEFALRYRHSVYRAEVTETFAAAGDGFRLVAATVGRRTLEAGGRRLPLYAEGADPARLVLSVRS